MATTFNPEIILIPDLSDSFQFRSGRFYRPLITVPNANKTQAAISRKVENSPMAGRSTPSTGRVPSAPRMTAIIHVIFIGDLNFIFPPKYRFVE